MSVEVKFFVKDKVFAKVKGYPPWPAIITSFKDDNVPSQITYRVHFYGTGELGECKGKDICLYEENKYKLGKSKRFKKKFSKALLEIENDDGNVYFSKDKAPIFETPENEGRLIIDQSKLSQQRKVVAPMKNKSIYKEPTAVLKQKNKEKSTDDREKNKELFEVYTVFKEIFSIAPPILKSISSDSVDIEYKNCADHHIDFEKIDENFKDEKYKSVTDAIADIRLVFLNCYKFYGARSDHTLKSLKIEELFEQKINNLDENFIKLADVQLTFNVLKIEGRPRSILRYPKDCYDSDLLRCVAHYRPDRLKESHETLSKMLITGDNDGDNNAHLIKDIECWENEIHFHDNYRYIRSMWELSEIGKFLAIIFKEFHFDIVNQGEIERMFLMPKESQTMGKIMTTLLTPFNNNRQGNRGLSYEIWFDKLKNKVSKWFKIYHIEKKNKVRVLFLLGIHPDFWDVLGDTNPLDKYDYCELPYFMKVLLVKGLCDYISIKYKTIKNILSKCDDQKFIIWKNEMGTEEYYFFNLMPDLRVYFRNTPNNKFQPSLQLLQSDNGGEEDSLSIPSIHDAFYTKSRVIPNEKDFMLIADSVQGLRSFIDGLYTEDPYVTDNLINAFEDFIDKFEPKERNYIVLNNSSKIKLYNDWKLCEEKRLKMLKGISGEKRKRYPVPKLAFLHPNEGYGESCDYSNLTELSSDSEDEWGAQNFLKNKTVKPMKPHSKIIELEKNLNKNTILNLNIFSKNKKENGKIKKNCENIKRLKNSHKNSLPIKDCNENLDISENAEVIDDKNSILDIQYISSSDEDVKIIYTSPVVKNFSRTLKNNLLKSHNSKIMPENVNKTKEKPVKITNTPSSNIECKIVSKSNLDGEVKFFFILPNGKLCPISDDVINDYLRDHNNVLPDYWLVPSKIITN